MILGDNIFYGHGLIENLSEAATSSSGAIGFSHSVENPSEYGVITFGNDGNPISIEEKPDSPASNLAVTGIYFYDKTAGERARKLKPSARGELEITDLNKSYLHDNLLGHSSLNSNYAWFDTGNPDEMFAASMYVKSVQDRTQTMIGCIEGESYKQGYITRDEFIKIKDKMPHCSYKTDLVMSYCFD